MDFSFVTELYIPIAVVAGLVVGFVLKKWIPTDNKWIPTILPIIGIIVACLATKSIDITVIVAGAVSGLASVGLHQAFAQHIYSGRPWLTEELFDELTDGWGTDDFVEEDEEDDEEYDEEEIADEEDGEDNE